MLRKRATGNTASGQLGHKTRLHVCESNAHLKYTFPSFTNICLYVDSFDIISLLNYLIKRKYWLRLNIDYRACGIDIYQAYEFKYANVYTLLAYNFKLVGVYTPIVSICKCEPTPTS